MSGYNISALRSQFPILGHEVHGQPLVYLDNAATSQKPRAVLDASRNYYELLNSNIHRGTHYLAQEATAAHERARDTVAAHLNAGSREEIIFTSGTTDGINLVASVLGYSGRIDPGDTIVISNLEHHSNIVPWQMLCERSGASLEVIPVHEDGTLDLECFHRLLDAHEDTLKLVALTHISNAFGTVLPVQAAIKSAHEAGALVLIDGAQAVPHLALDLQALDVDFYVFSGHKVYAPTGIGVLYGKRALLESLPPWRGGGEMIKKVTYDGTTYNDLPYKFEAGTPNIEGAIALAAALDFLNGLGLRRPPRTRAYPHRACRQRALRHRGCQTPWSPRPCRFPLLQRGGHPPLRPRHSNRQNGRGPPHRPPLLPTAHGPLWHHRNPPSLLCLF